MPTKTPAPPRRELFLAAAASMTGMWAEALGAGLLSPYFLLPLLLAAARQERRANACQSLVLPPTGRKLPTDQERQVLQWRHFAQSCFVCCDIDEKNNWFPAGTLSAWISSRDSGFFSRPNEFTWGDWGLTVHVKSQNVEGCVIIANKTLTVFILKCECIRSVTRPFTKHAVCAHPCAMCTANTKRNEAETLTSQNFLSGRQSSSSYNYSTRRSGHYSLGKVHTCMYACMDVCTYVCMYVSLSPPAPYIGGEFKRKETLVSYGG